MMAAPPARKSANGRLEFVNKVFLMQRLSGSLMMIGVTFAVACSAARPYGPKETIHNVGYRYYNSYLIAKKDRLLLIDCGLPTNIEKLIKNITKLGFDPAQISHLVITHVHADHVGAAAWLQAKYGTQVIVHRNEKHLAEKGSFDSLRIVTPKRLLGKLAYQEVEWHFPAFAPDVLVTDSLDLRTYGFDAMVKTVRGHTQGSVVVVYGNDLFVGDLIRGGYILGRRKPEYHFFAEDFSQVLTVLKQLLAKPYNTWYVGHGGPLESNDVRDFLNQDN